MIKAFTERKRFRKNLGSIKENVEIPNLIEIQKDSYLKFIKEGIGEALKEFSPITDYAGKAEVYFLDFTLEDRPKLSKAETKRKRT